MTILSLFSEEQLNLDSRLEGLCQPFIAHNLSSGNFGSLITVFLNKVSELLELADKDSYVNDHFCPIFNVIWLDFDLYLQKCSYLANIQRTVHHSKFDQIFTRNRNRIPVAATFRSNTNGRWRCGRSSSSDKYVYRNWWETSRPGYRWWIEIRVIRQCRRQFDCHFAGEVSIWMSSVIAVPYADRDFVFLQRVYLSFAFGSGEFVDRSIVGTFVCTHRQVHHLSHHFQEFKCEYVDECVVAFR